MKTLYLSIIAIAGITAISIASFAVIYNTPQETSMPKPKLAGDQVIEIRGNDAQAICGLLRIPCPSNPVFSGRMLDGNTFISFSGMDRVYDITLNKTHVCVTPGYTQQTECENR